MTNPQTIPAVRRVTRALALVPILLLGSAFPAGAAPSQWPEAPSVSALEFLLVILLIPTGLALVITLLAAIPSMRGGGSTSYQPGLAWRHEPEWFGGPRDGLEKADRSDPEALEASGERGGASGHW